MNKAQQLLEKNPIFTAMREQMLNYQRAYLSGYDFKTNTRKKRPSEDENLYQDLIDNTVSQPICRYIVDTINDVLFEPGVKRELEFVTQSGTRINPDNLEWTQLFLLDSDLQNRSLNAFMEHVGDLTSIYGHCWVFVDMPKQSEGNLGRPYCVAVNPTMVYDWTFSYYGGKPIVQQVKVLEAETQDHYFIKHYELGTDSTPSRWTSYQINKDVKRNQVRITDEGTFPAGMMVPGFIVYGRRDPRRFDIGVSDIDAASDAQREYYKLECEAYTSIQFAKTIIRADKGVRIPVHAGAITRASEGQVEAIKVDLHDVKEIMTKQDQLLEQIEALTGLGGLRTSKNQVQSGVAIIEERKQLHRLAKAKARLMETAEEMIFTFAARFMDMRWAGEVYYDTDYEAHDTNYRIALLKQARELVSDNEMVDALVTKEVIRMLAPKDNSHVYENYFVDTLENSKTKELLVNQEQNAQTRDIGSQTPKTEIESPDSSKIDTHSEITNTGESHNSDSAITSMINHTQLGR